MSIKKIAYNTFAQIGGKIVGFFISGILLVAIAQQLGTYNMGNYTTIIAFVAFFVSISDLGANLILVREISQNEADRERITGEFFGFRLTFSLFTMLLGPVVAAFIPQYGALIVKGTLIITASQILLLVNQMFISMLQTQLLLDRAVLAELINRLINLAIVLWALHSGIRGEAFFFTVLYATLVGAAVNTAVTFYFARRLWPIRPQFDLNSWRRTLITIAPIGLFTFLGIIHFKADTIMLSLLKNPEEVGIYGYAYKIGEILFTFPGMYVGVVFPRLSQLYLTDKVKFRKFAQATFDTLVVGTIPFLTFVLICAKYFTLLLSRASYSDGLLAGQALQILTVAMLAWFIGTLFVHILIMANDYRGLIRNLTLAVIINIALNLYFIPRYSFFGAALVTCISELILLVITLRYTKRATDFTPRLNFLPATLFSTAVSAVVLLFFTRLPAVDYQIFANDGRLQQMAVIVGLALVAALAFLVVFWPLAGRQLRQAMHLTPNE